MGDPKIYNISSSDLPSLAESLGEKEVVSINVDAGEKIGDDCVQLIVEHSNAVSAFDPNPCRDIYKLVRNNNGNILLQETECGGIKKEREILPKDMSWPALQLPFVTDAGPKDDIQTPWKEAKQITLQLPNVRNAFYGLFQSGKAKLLFDLWALPANDFSKEVEKIFFSRIEGFPSVSEEELKPWRAFARMLEELRLENGVSEKNLDEIRNRIVSRYPFMEEGALNASAQWISDWVYRPPVPNAVSSVALPPFTEERKRVYQGKLKEYLRDEKTLKKDLLRLRLAYVLEKFGVEIGQAGSFSPKAVTQFKETRLKEFDLEIAEPAFMTLREEAGQTVSVLSRIQEMTPNASDIQWKMFDDHTMPPDWEPSAYIQPLVALSDEIYVDDAAVNKVSNIFPANREKGGPFVITYVEAAAAVQDLHLLQKKGIPSLITVGKQEFLPDQYAKEILDAIFVLEEKGVFRLDLGARHLLELEQSRYSSEEKKKRGSAAPAVSEDGGAEEEASVPWYRNWWVIAGGALAATATVVTVVALSGGEEARRNEPTNGGNGNGNGGNGNGNGDDKTGRNPTITVGP